MERVYIKAYAKINLSLDVVARRSDGYHNVDMIMQSVDLWDEIVLKEIAEGIEMDTNIPQLPCNENNIAWKAAELVKRKYGIDKGIHISIVKNIPLEAGLAGGSADCGAVLLGLNKLWNLGIGDMEMRTLGKSLGADVPFCLMGGTAQAKGIGDILTPIESNLRPWFTIVKPDFGVSTKEIYSNLRVGDIMNRPNNSKMIGYLKNGQISKMAENMVNVLEEVTIPLHPNIESLKRELINLGALGSLMSGSGPSVFGIFENETSAQNAADVLNKKYSQLYVVKAIQKGSIVKTVKR